MALRAGLVRRFLSTSIFSSQSRPGSAASASFSADSDTNIDAAPAEPNPTLFISGLNKRTTATTLYESFSKFGEVVTVNIITDHASGFSKGYGFVRYATTEDAEKGIKEMDAQIIDDWLIFAEFARPKKTPGQYRASSQTYLPNY